MLNVEDISSSSCFHFDSNYLVAGNLIPGIAYVWNILTGQLASANFTQ